MMNLTFIEKNKFEKLFGMKSGYVLDFSDRTFQEFVGDSAGIDIYEEKYIYGSGSKANRLRGFWNVESNYNIGKLLEKLLEYWLEQAQSGEISYDITDQNNYKDCLVIVAKLKTDNPVENIDAIQANSDDRTFKILAESIRESINKNEPEKGLDRLHTFTIKYVRQLCENHQIAFDKETPLHSLFGGYVKKIVNEGLIESVMTERILKSSISVLEAFNGVRNNQSFAHDNVILNYNESILIFNNVTNVIRFLETIEKPKTEQKEEIIEEWNDLPF
ncbi:abortive infection family protein [Flavobacterium xueshanense]|nr:abortive infection family protein [Flavobacterium xueshanense]